ncbi:MAG: hypothetical protein O3C40_20395 [Planctomycetota bacterium]|nr:hypothetical protein [Planctomycetota bacterium]
MTKRAFIAAICLLAASLGASLSGCATVDSKSDAAAVDDPEWLQNLKALKGTGPSAGISREARDIESSLGAF